MNINSIVTNIEQEILRDKVILITGGTGSFGNAMVDILLPLSPKEIRIVSRDEKKQDDMRKKYHDDRLKFFIGDIRDYDAIKGCFIGVDYCFAAAALKQIPSCEFFPLEAIKTNILGNINVMNACLEGGVKKAVFLSTDKAAYPVSTMGMTKALMEKAVISKAVALGEKSSTQFCLTRFGNVMCSRGSVIPLFIQQIKNKNPITITNPKMTRFMMSLQDAVKLVLHSFINGKQGELFVMKAPACSIQTLADAVLSCFSENFGIRYIGTRHSEKLYETLVTSEEMPRAIDEGDFYRIVPDLRSLDYKETLTDDTSYHSLPAYTSESTKQLSVSEVRDLLLKLELVN